MLKQCIIYNVNKRKNKMNGTKLTKTKMSKAEKEKNGNGKKKDSPFFVHNLQYL